MKMLQKNRASVAVAACVAVIAVAVIGLFMIVNQKTNVVQATPAVHTVLEFAGEYRIGDGAWHPYVKGEHISATDGDVTLKGHFYFNTGTDQLIATGTPMVFYLNHVSFEAYHNGSLCYLSDCENPYIGNMSCGMLWAGKLIYPAVEGDSFEIVLKNPHKIGNETAVDEFLAHAYAGDLTVLKDQLMEKSELQRSVALGVFVLAFVVLGIAIFAGFQHIPQTPLLWLFAAVVLCVGGWFYFGSENSVFWNTAVLVNTAGCEMCKMLYGFFACCLSLFCLNPKTRPVGKWLVAILGVTVCVLILIPGLSGAKIYDMKPWWMIAQTLVGVGLMALCGFTAREEVGRRRVLPLLCIFAGLSMLLDMAAAYCCWWSGGELSKIVFLIYFACALVFALEIVPANIRMAMRAKELERELEESRIAIMLSQIQPHFIHNTLTTISQLCLDQPEEASRLTKNFSRYLRGNFGGLDSPTPISVRKEIEHVRHYLAIEQVRFPDMHFEFDLRSDDFILPALSIQPLVENAVKHGLMKLEKGGTIRITTYETSTVYCVEVQDTGVGFDVAALEPRTGHIGLHNIQSRLKSMCGGTLTVESTPGKGTTATITIPKEERLK